MHGGGAGVGGSLSWSLRVGVIPFFFNLEDGGAVLVEWDWMRCWWWNGLVNRGANEEKQVTGCWGVGVIPSFFL